VVWLRNKVNDYQCLFSCCRVISEPVKGAKKGGMRGGAVGLGKGILGLVCKPMKGTIDLVTQTTRGISNTPKTMYVGFSKMVRKVPRR